MAEKKATPKKAKAAAKKVKAAPKAEPKAEAKTAEPKAAARKAKKATPQVSKAKVASAADEFRTKSPDELADALVKLGKEQFNLRFQRANGQLEKTNRVRSVRRDIARIQTILNEQRRKAAAQG
jgi:large subunit ribosomal protein L29